MSSDERFLVLLLTAIDDAGLDAVVVGMAGAALLGAPVTTLDIDLLVRDTPRNRAKLDQVAKTIGGVARVRASELAEIETIVGAAAPVDIVYDQLLGGLRFASVKARSVEVQIGDRFARVASLADIIRSKRAADRPKDRAQLPMLEQTAAVAAKLAEKSPARKAPTRRRKRRRHST